MNLWPHQQRALAELDGLLQSGQRRICVTSPTGGGKSRVMFEHMTTGGACALYTDRRMLLKQLGDELVEREVVFGYRAAGYEPRLLEDLQLCMVQTEGSRSLDGPREVHAAQRVYIDEAHKNGGPTMQQLLAAHEQARPDCAVIGFTATPLNIGHIYERLVVAGTNSELRACGAHVPAHHYGPDEPDTKWITKIVIGEGECGIPTRKRREFAQRVFGRVIENYWALNPQQLPSILFAPGVKESIWFAQELSENGIPSAHIDGDSIWVDGEQYENTDELRDQIAERSKSGDIKVVCNRFVLREGIDWPWLYHAILATVFGSLTSYLQAGGRMLRSYPGLDHKVIQDHGGNWHRHGSLNADREWHLTYTDRIAAGMREKRIRDKAEPEPICCPVCHAIRLHGPKCHQCGYKHDKKTRPVLQADGTLREAKGDIFRARRTMNRDAESYKREWIARVKNVPKSRKEHVRNATFAQLEVWFARDNGWKYPNHEWPYMPVNDADWFRPVGEVKELRGCPKPLESVQYAEAPF